jgi:hypothetical protein
MQVQNNDRRQALTDVQVDRLKMAHATRLEEYRALRAEYNQNVNLINTLLGTFYTGLGLFVTVLNSSKIILQPEGYALIAFLFNCIGWTQLHYLRTNLSLLEYVSKTLTPQIYALVRQRAPDSLTDVPNELQQSWELNPEQSWEHCYVRQVNGDRTLGTPVILARYLMPYLASFACFIIYIFQTYPQRMRSGFVLHDIWALSLEVLSLWFTFKSAQIYFAKIQEMAKESQCPPEIE